MKSIALLVLVGILVSGCGGSDGSDDDDRPEDLAGLVYIDKGEIQCEPQSGRPLRSTEQLLVDAGIDVVESDCGELTGMAYATVCGAGTAAVNIHRIREENVADAREQGFNAMAEWVEQDEENGYNIVDCPDEN